MRLDPIFYKYTLKFRILSVILIIIILLPSCTNHSKIKKVKVAIPDSLLVEDLHKGLHEKLVKKLYRFIDVILEKKLVRKAIDIFYDSYNMALLRRISFPVTERQNPVMYNLVQKACQVLHVDEDVQVFIIYDSEMNVFVMNIEKPIIVITSTLCEYMPLDELIFVIGHELGHIKCEQILIDVLFQALSNISSGTLNSVIVALLSSVGFLRYLRTAEEIADRAGLIACQDIEIAQRALMRLLTGSKKKKFYKYMDLNAYLQKYKEDVDSENWFTKIRIIKKVLSLTHPFIPERITALREYWNSKYYKSIISNSKNSFVY